MNRSLFLLALFLGLMAVPLRLPGQDSCLLPGAAAAPCADGCTDHGEPPATAGAEEADAHGADDGHDHGGPSVYDMTDAQRRAVRCEHLMAAADCRACSAEVGVVFAPSDGSLVETSTVALATLRDMVETYGQVALDDSAASHVSPRVGGVIGTVHVELGQQVTAGTPLFEVFSVEVGQAAAALRKAAALTTLAARELERGRRLFKDRLLAEKELYRLEFDLEQARIEHDAARRQLVILGLTDADLAAADSDDALLRGRVVVRSPVDGVVIQKHAVAGERAEPGRDVLLVADLALVWVWAGVTDRDAGLLLRLGRHPEARAEILVDAVPGQVFHGALNYVSPLADPTTRTIRVRVVADNTDGLLLPGMFCRVRLPLREHQVPAVPLATVQRDGAESFVFVPFGEGSFAVRCVTVGQPHDDLIPVLSGLAPGDRVVTRGTFMLKSEVLKDRMGAG